MFGYPAKNGGLLQTKQQTMERDILEGVRLNFDSSNLLLLNLSIALIMFGVALSLKKESFIELVRNPKAALTGLASQFILLPFLTFLLVWLMEPLPGLALGMVLVAACPGGNVSNFFTYLSKGNVALSISLTSISSMLAVVMTPLNLEIWGSLLGASQATVRQVDISFYEMFQTIMLIIGIPLVLGLWINQYWPKWAAIIQKPLKYLSFAILAGIIFFAFSKNLDLFADYYHYVIFLVFIHNALALSGGYFFSRLVGNNLTDSRSIAMETGIQNSGLGLVIIFTFFDGQGGMALITAWWGIWHIISGMAVSQFFAYKAATVQR